ncbi:MAG: acyl-CoA dehydratase activase-related protein [Paludibacteraceae bacterium]|nr:acyl-CoA dehydratase activase-related protein [Paludibacteraceae bacterium]
MFKIGIDVGSTTAKIVVIDENNNICFSKYRRHNAQIMTVLAGFMAELYNQIGNQQVSLKMTGSIAMGLAERFAFPFIQEVVAATKAVQCTHPNVNTMIDIGGEDAKIVFFNNAEAEVLRMNGNCAGGTGAFIDQMSIILGVTVDEMNDLAQRATQIYPIASRCGVFSKTDIQNLVAKNVSRENIAASIFHAVAVQAITTLAHGCDIKTPMLFCGGPLTFLPALRYAFKNYLSLEDADVILPDMGELMPAYGTALAQVDKEFIISLAQLMDKLKQESAQIKYHSSTLKPIFESKKAYDTWRKRMDANPLKCAEITAGQHRVFLGIDSGSTTTKVVVINESGQLLYRFYENNGGKPIETVLKGLTILQQLCKQKNAKLYFAGSCSTGYGEDLIKAAFNLHAGMIETMAHYKAAYFLDNQVSFILDIGGQDMKAIFVNHGVIDRIEINEACSSGCGSFIETFAKGLGYSTAEFASKACESVSAADLGTRCTVFMNSKVKQVLREGASVADISAGLAYSVVKNCLYKVLKLKDTSVLGKHIVVQGGTMRNDAVVRVLELLTGAEVTRCDSPELMGALGCALYAAEHQGQEILLDDMLQLAHYATRALRCAGCENTCEVIQYQFTSGKKYYSGNRCEKYFNANLSAKIKGENAFQIKNKLLFNRQTAIEKPLLKLGIPKVLNMFEEFPFWHTLFTECGIEVILSDNSDYAQYEKTARMVMSDNLCFPAKLVHSHIQNLSAKQVDRIFMPFVVYEQCNENEQNSYNCPIVTGYSVVVKNVEQTAVPIDSPVISFKDKDLLFKQCKRYLKSFKLSDDKIQRAFKKATAAQTDYVNKIYEHNKLILEKSNILGTLSVVLAGRPYHTDSLIQHGVSEMMAQMGINVLTDDVARGENIAINYAHFLSQWSYPNRIMRAAKWCVQQENQVPLIQMTSFGCGPDAFLVDELRDLLLRHNGTYTLLKLDDINNIGSMKLRVRSLVESLKLANEYAQKTKKTAFITTPVFNETYSRRKIIVPFFTSFISPLIPSIMRAAGYEVDCLPVSDEVSAEWGLKFANNEVCYPATLVVGDIIKVFKEQRYHPSEVVVGITQTGGQCRASSYLPLIKKALVDAGYTDTPVMALTFGADLGNNQPAFKVDWKKVLPIALKAVLYSDVINKCYHASVVREKEQGMAMQLQQKYMQTGAKLIDGGRSEELYDVLAMAAREFDTLCVDKDLPKVGVVGEIYLKFNHFANGNIVDWLVKQGVEVVPPVLTDFFTQTFVNSQVRVADGVEKRKLSDFLKRVGYYLVKNEIKKVNKIGASFRYFTPFSDIFHEAQLAEKVINLNAQFGEGWLLPAEVMSYAENGVQSVISLQPFGCIANHIVSKGVEKKIKSLYPSINLLSLDFDSGVSDVNVKNRLLLFVDKLKEKQDGK